MPGCSRHQRQSAEHHDRHEMFRQVMSAKNRLAKNAPANDITECQRDHREQDDEQKAFNNCPCSFCNC